MNSELHHKPTLEELSSRIDILESNMGLLATKEDIENIVRDTLIDVLFKAGSWTNKAVITIAGILIALAVIGGGFKWVLGLIGFVRLK